MRLCWIVGVVVFIGFTSNVNGNNVRVKVATLDGAPVYHWRVFKSIYRDDNDRALVLRLFYREGFKMPDRFVDGKLKEEVAQHFGGDKEKLLQALKEKGATLGYYRQFLAEEMIIKALRNRNTQASRNGHPSQTEPEWLASLRKGAHIELAPPNPSHD